jgi:hypothetical protein
LSGFAWIGSRFVRAALPLILGSAAALAEGLPPVAPPSPEIRAAFRLSEHYQKCFLAEGFPIVGSAKAQDMALREAGWLIDRMLEGREDIRRAMIEARVRFSVMAVDEFTTSVPEHSDLKPGFYWDKRARGLGATPARPSVSCGEENLLCLHGDPYAKENILIHEFGHALDEMGLRRIDPSWAGRLRETYERARAAGLWADKYAMVNKQEYWAEGVQSWFDCNRENDREHNHVDTRAELLAYDPGLAALCREVFGERDWRYTRPETRLELPHLRGYDRDRLPRFAWPRDLSRTYQTFSSPEELPAAPEPAAWVSLAPVADTTISQRGGAASSLILVSGRADLVRVAWIDFEGRPRNPQILRPGMFLLLSTYAGHVWRVEDEAGNALARYSAEGEVCRAVVR